MLKTLHYARQLLRSKVLKSNNRGIQTSSIKNSSKEPLWVYRRGPYPAPIYIERLANAAGTMMWYWVIYHCITQYEHITGHWTYPDTSKWTNEELGIPPDHEG